MTTIYNLTIPKGTTVQKTFRFLHTLIVSQDLLPSITAPPTVLQVEQLPCSLPVGYIIKFPQPKTCATLDLVVAGAAALGDTTINIEPYTGTKRISCRTSTKILPVNLTGVIWRGAIRKAEGDINPLLQFSFSVPNPVEGTVTMEASSTLTAALPSNCRFDQLPEFYETPLSIQKADNFEDQRVYNAAYFWDVERENSSGVVERVFYGRVWVPWESAQEV